MIRRDRLEWPISSEWIAEARHEEGAVLIVTRFGARYAFQTIDRNRICLVAPVGPGVIPERRSDGQRMLVDCYERVSAERRARSS